MSCKVFPSMVTLVLVLFLILGHSPGFTAEFAAELTVSSSDMNDTLSIFVKDYTYRLENSSDDGRIILIQKKGVTWALEPGSDTFRELDPAEEALLNPVAAWEDLSYEMRGQGVGMDTVAGFECEIFGYNRKGDPAIVFKRWYASELNFIIKQELDDKSGVGHMEIDNIVLGELEDALFDVSPLPSGTVVPEVDRKPAAISTKVAGTAPVGRRLSAGGELRVTVDPTRSTRVKVKNLAEGESTCRIALFRDGEALKETDASKANIFTLTYSGERKTALYGSQLHVDEVVVGVELGAVEIRVEPEPSSFDHTHLCDFYLPFPGGQFVVDTTRSLEITLTGDSQDGPMSTGKIVVGTGEYVNTVYQFEPIEEVLFSLENGASQTWSFRANKKVKDVHIKIDAGGALKVKMWQP